MRHLISDFLDQSLFMKVIILWGWLCMLVMVTSLYATVSIIVKDYCDQREGGLCEVLAKEND